LSYDLGAVPTGTISYSIGKKGNSSSSQSRTTSGENSELNFAGRDLLAGGGIRGYGKKSWNNDSGRVEWGDGGDATGGDENYPGKHGNEGSKAWGSSSYGRGATSSQSAYNGCLIIVRTGVDL
jgi:hypothetical protein